MQRSPGGIVTGYAIQQGPLVIEPPPGRPSSSRTHPFGADPRVPCSLLGLAPARAPLAGLSLRRSPQPLWRQRSVDPDRDRWPMGSGGAPGGRHLLSVHVEISCPPAETFVSAYRDFDLSADKGRLGKPTAAVENYYARAPLSRAGPDAANLLGPRETPDHRARNRQSLCNPGPPGCSTRLRQTRQRRSSFRPCDERSGSMVLRAISGAGGHHTTIGRRLQPVGCTGRADPGRLAERW